MKTSSTFAIAALALFGFGVSATAQEEDTTPMLDRGTQELSISGRLDLPDLDELDYDIEGSYGYFFRDGWEIGLGVTAADFGGQDRLEISGFTEYNFMRENQLVPFIGGGLGLVSANFDDEVVIDPLIEPDDGLIVDMEGGVKFFMQPYMAISASIAFKFATEDVFATDDAIEDSLSTINIGMRYYF